MGSLGSTAEAFQKNLSSAKDMHAFVVEKTLKIIYIYKKYIKNYKGLLLQSFLFPRNNMRDALNKS